VTEILFDIFFINLTWKTSIFARKENFEDIAQIRLNDKSPWGINKTSYVKIEIEGKKTIDKGAVLCGLYYKTITIIIMMIVSDATI